MPWLTGTEDEVQRFHPEFENAANEALQLVGLGQDFEWRHHVTNIGSTVIPDYVLLHRRTQRWVLAFELKRTEDAVRSTRFQIQAKGYAETNQDRYDPQLPKFFAISNLEITILFALNTGHPPNECRIQNGFFRSGSFSTDDRATHRAQFIADLRILLAVVTNGLWPPFDTVWPSVLATFTAFSAGLPASDEICIQEPTTPNWELVRNYFGSTLQEDSARIFLLRCLMAEYLRGVLARYDHPSVNTIPALQPTPNGVANSLAAIRNVDFETLFEAGAPAQYRALTNAYVLDRLRGYVNQLNRREFQVAELARNRSDHGQLIDDLTDALLPIQLRDERGRVQTDAELADVLAYLTIDSAGMVVDPCCGEGALLSAAYRRLRSLGRTYQDALGELAGIEADAIAARVAAMSIALKEPSLIGPQANVNISRADTFAESLRIREAQFVVMNPPFKRYEAQDLYPVPDELRDYYRAVIAGVDGQPSTTTRQQANLFHYYVEYIGKVVRDQTTLGFVLDNRWYHSRYGQPLKQFLLSHFQLLGLVEYPHTFFFEHWTIATSLLIIRKVTDIPDDHWVKFIRCGTDPRLADLTVLARAFRDGGAWPTNWRVREERQSDLDPHEGWKRFFASDLSPDFRLGEWPTLATLFKRTRRGSIEKEGGGVAVFECPFNRTQYGPRRLRRLNGNPFQTTKGAALTPGQNAELRTLAAAIPEEFRGYALKNSDEPEHYVLTVADVVKTQIIEPPSLRLRYQLFLYERRSPWTDFHVAAIAEMFDEPGMREYIEGIEELVGLTADVLPDRERWIILREPFAGELIIPRKMRTGHRVYINLFAFDPRERQIRISSNFLTYGSCRARDHATGLTRETAVTLIAAFLVSSFGQLQFEIEGYNREGCLAIEAEQVERIRIFDPRWVRLESRQQILDAFAQLEYPVSTTRFSVEQPARNELDRLFAAEISTRYPQFDAEALVSGTHTALDEWLGARLP